MKWVFTVVLGRVMFLPVPSTFIQNIKKASQLLEFRLLRITKQHFPAQRAKTSDEDLFCCGLYAAPGRTNKTN